MNHYQLDILGALRLTAADRSELRVTSRKAKALLAYLAMRPDEAHSRDHLATLLWEDADPEQSRASLRQALAGLRRLTGEHALIRADADTMQLATYVRVDASEFRAALASSTRASLERAASLYRGDLLEGFDARSTAFDEAVQAERARIRSEAAAGLSKLVSLCTQDESFDAAILASRQLTSLEPLNEAAHRSLMELYARRGLYTEALRQYRTCRDALRRELDIAPEPATEALYRELMRKRRASGTHETGEQPQVDEDHAQAESTDARLMRPALRDAVVLVARMEGLLALEAVLDPEETRALSLRYQARVSEAAREFGGVADERIGASMTCVFGLPQLQGNEAERAVQAAVYLREQLAKQPLRPGTPLPLQVGIAQGQVLRNAGEEVFPLAGPPVHRAHALAAAASESQILLSDELCHALGDRINSEAVRNPKNVQHVIGWELHSMQVVDATAASRFFVGRRPELAMLIASLDRCTSSAHGRAMIVRGEPGIGKTRLCEALRVNARERQIGVHCAQVLDFGQKASRRPLAALTVSLLGLDPDAPGTARARAVAEHASSTDEVIFLSELVDAPMTDELRTLEAAIPAARRTRGIDEALGSLLRKLCERAPQLITIEDLHWASAEDTERLCALLSEVANYRCFLVATTRPEGEQANALIKAGGRRCPVTTLDLAPMADDEAHELAAHYSHLPAETIEACIARAEGYPLFLDQLLRAASADPRALPASIRSLVITRVDRLSANDQTGLYAAAVLGAHCELDALRFIAGIDVFEADALIDSGLMRQSAFELEFAHALFRDAVYQSIVRSERRELHSRAAQWFAGREPLLEAEHLAAAEDPRAGSAFIEAARTERRALRVERALEAARKAQTVAASASVLHGATCLIGELCLQLGRTHLALAAFRESLESADTPLARVESHLGIASALRIMDRYQESLDELDQAESSLDATATPQHHVRLWTLRGNVYFPLSRVDECLQAHAKAHESAVAANSPLDIARADGGLGDAWYQRGRMRTAYRHFASCIDAARKHKLQGVLMSYLPMLSVTQTFLGELSNAMRTNDEALELALKLGDQRGELITCLVTSTALMAMGEFARAAEMSTRARKLSQQVGTRRFEAESMGALAAAMLTKGDRGTALALLQEALKISRSTGMTYCGPVLLGFLARATSDPEERRAALHEGEQLLAQGCVSHSYIEFYIAAIEVSLAAGAWSEAVRYAGALADYTKEESLAWPQLMIERGQALARVATEGMSDELRRELERLRQRAEALGAKYAMPAIEEQLKNAVAVA